MKRIWKSLKFIIPTAAEAPTDYPKLPGTLMGSHPELSHRAYVGLDQPAMPPKTLDILSLGVLKTTTGSRCTKRNVFGVAQQRHLIALETMLVLGKLCPQRLAGEVKLIGVHATRIARRVPV